MERLMKVLRVLSLLPVLAIAFLLTGCNDLVVLDPMPAIVDDHLIGNWAGADGKLDSVFKRGPDGDYEYWSADALSKGEKPTAVRLTRVGNQLFLQRRAACSDFLFHTPDPAEAKQGCWAIYRAFLKADTLEFDAIDTKAMLNKSLAGTLKGFKLVCGMSTDADGKVEITDILLNGTAADVARFLETYANDQAYLPDRTKLHRI
jgi:hypothetical protein